MPAAGYAYMQMHRMHGQFNFSQHASPYFPASHAQWSSHFTFTDISMPKDYDPCSLWSKNFIGGTSVLYCAFQAHSAMPFLISRASDNVESRKRPNGTSPEYPTSSRSCRRLPHRLSLHPNRGPVLKVSTLGIWAFEAFWSLFPKVGKTGQYCCYIHRLFP